MCHLHFRNQFHTFRTFVIGLEVFWYISYVVPIVAAIMLVKVHNNSDKDTVAKSRINNRVGGLRPQFQQSFVVDCKSFNLSQQSALLKANIQCTIFSSEYQLALHKALMSETHELKLYLCLFVYRLQAFSDYLKFCECGFSDAPYYAYSYVRGVSINQDVYVCVHLCTSLSFWTDQYLSKLLQMDIDFSSQKPKDLLELQRVN